MGKESDSLCEEIAKQSGGVCLLGFSRGKDSVCAWLQLRKYFSRIIPFHCATAPRLTFADKSLKYYEKYFGTKIERYMSGSVVDAVDMLVYQPLEDEDAIDRLDLKRYDNNGVADLVRKKHGLQKAYCAYGINASDSIDRRIYVNQMGGRNDTNLTFYPCYDWSKAEVLARIEEEGIKLAPDYLLSSRTLAAIPAYRIAKPMLDQWPEEFAKLEAVFPFLKASIARMHFRALHKRDATVTEEGEEE
jgi:hypothetical protein